MRWLFWKKKRKKKNVKRKSRIKYKANKPAQSQRRDDEILLKLDAIMTFLRKHDLDIKETFERMAIAKKILKESNLDQIIKDKLSHGMQSKNIVRELVSQGACSRATAYRCISRQKKRLQISITSH